MITERRITADCVGEEIKQLYQTAFPVEEQIPWDGLLVLTDRMALDFTAYYDDGRFVGITVVYPRKTFNWFWYFAVREELRGKGYGGLILSRLRGKYKGSANILDMESPEQASGNMEQRRRRHAFYLRNGFRDTGVGRTFKGVDYTIMMNGEGVFTMHDYDIVLDELRSFWPSMPNAEK